MTNAARARFNPLRQLADERAQLTDWNDARGFGFAMAERDGARLFVHATAFARTARRPMAGDRLLVRRGAGRDGRLAIVRARLANAPNMEAVSVPSGSAEAAQLARAVRLALAALLVLELVALRAPGAVLAIYGAMGVVSATLYAIDKRAARRGEWRVPERVLQGVDMAGGLLGGLLAEVALHHKTAKADFALVTIGTAFVHGALLAGWLLR